jgi:subtilase family serine protease
MDGVLRLALSQGSVVSLSAGLGEDCFTPAQVAGLNSALQADQERHVTVVASSGDFGAASTACAGPGVPTSVREADLPASDPLVLAAGGTTLDADPAAGTYRSESACHTPPGTASSSGGGFSHLFPRPAYQDGIAGIGADRGFPDVASDAAGPTGMTLAVSAGAGKDYFYPGAGTSAATPLWTALIALANQYAGRHLGFVNPAIYRIGRSASYHQAFHDITTGSSTITFPQGTIPGYQASPGWDPVTGWEAPTRRRSSPCWPATPAREPQALERKNSPSGAQLDALPGDARASPISGRRFPPAVTPGEGRASAAGRLQSSSGSPARQGSSGHRRRRWPPR